MKLVVDSQPFTVNLRVETTKGTVSIQDFIKFKLLSDKRSYTHFNMAAGVDHATRYNFMNGRSKSVRVALLMLDALGYELALVKKETK